MGLGAPDNSTLISILSSAGFDRSSLPSKESKLPNDDHDHPSSVDHPSPVQVDDHPPH